MDIPNLLLQLDDAISWDAQHIGRDHLQSLCKQSAAAIRMLQAESRRGMADVHARFLLQLGEGIKTLGLRMQGDA